MFQILRIAKLGTIGEISGSAEHTFRERPTHNADGSRTHLNLIDGARSSSALKQGIVEKLVGVKKTKDSVLCIEYLITASPEWFDQAGKDDQARYWKLSKKWLVDRHGIDNIVCTNLQLDETTPHLVAYVLPIIEKASGKRKRSVFGVGGMRQTMEFDEPALRRLSAKTFCDGSEKLSAMQTDFHAKVASNFGLDRGEIGSVAKHEELHHWYSTLKPKMRAAEAKISHAEDVKLEQADRETALVDRVEALKKQVAKLHEADAFLKNWMTRLKTQEEALIEAFEVLPSKIKEKLAAIFNRKPAGVLNSDRVTDPLPVIQNPFVRLSGDPICTPNSTKRKLPSPV